MGECALERGGVQRFQSQDDYEDERARLESFEMSPWSPTDMEKACYEEQASDIFEWYEWYLPGEPDWDLKSHLESLRTKARGLAAGRVPDGVSKEGLEASHSQCGARSFAAGEGGPRQTLRGKPERLRGVDRAGGVAASGHERSEGAWHAEGCLV